MWEMDYEASARYWTDKEKDVHPYEEPLINIIPLGTESDL